jgi:type IV pilus assembly protein PilX
MILAPPPQARRQQGFVLVMALVFLVLLTILGVSALNTTSLEEKMAGNTKDRNLAFQAAETALLAGERWIEAQLQKPNFPDNVHGLYNVDTTSAVANWDAITWTSNVVSYPCSPSVTSSCGTGVGKISTQPKYIIEDLGEVPDSKTSLVVNTDYQSKGITMLRVTARGTGGTDAAVAMVQSTYSRQY